MAQTDTIEAAPAPSPNAQTQADEAGGPVLGFAVLCVQKAVEFNITDHKLHRATKDKELHEELEKLTESENSTYMFQLGGGCRIVGSCGAGGAPMTSACVGDSVAAFQGMLSNLEQLAEVYVPEPQNGPGTATPAEVVCHMYLKVGVELLTKLRGRFAFCMYESKQGRVLAARDGSGAVHLYQGHSPAEGLVITSTRALLKTCNDIKAFAPGDFKYGWHSEPRQFSSMEFGRRRSSVTSGPRRGSVDQGTGERRSIDMSNMNHAPRRSVDMHNHGSRRSVDQGHGHGGSQNGSQNGSRRTSVDHGSHGHHGNGHHAHHGHHVNGAQQAHQQRDPNRRRSQDSSGSDHSGDRTTPSSRLAKSTSNKDAAGRWNAPASPPINELKRLDVNAPEFKPTWGPSK